MTFPQRGEGEQALEAERWSAGPWAAWPQLGQSGRAPWGWQHLCGAVRDGQDMAGL